MTEAALQKSILPDHVRAQLLEQQQASINAPCAPAKEEKVEAQTEPVSILKNSSVAKKEDTSEQPRLTLNSVSGLLSRLDDQRVLYVLKKVPPHLLARALDQILQDGTATAMSKETTTDDSVKTELDRRNAERTDTDQTGKIIYNNLMSVTDCTIADMSPAGCRIKIGSTLDVPECFTLQIGNGGTKRECKIIWRKHHEMGVKFIA